MRKTFTFLAMMILPFLYTESYALAMQVKLAPKASRSITNDYAWAMNADCVVQSHSSNKIFVSVLKNKGTINGRRLSSGHGTSFMVRNNQHLSVKAEPGTEVTLSNAGTEEVNANCVVAT